MVNNNYNSHKPEKVASPKEIEVKTNIKDVKLKKDKTFVSTPQEKSVHDVPLVSLVSKSKKTTPKIDDKVGQKNQLTKLTKLTKSTEKHSTNQANQTNQTNQLTNLKIIKNKDIINYFKNGQKGQKQLEYVGYVFLHENKHEFSLKEVSSFLEISHPKLTPHLSRYVDDIYLRYSNNVNSKRGKLLEITKRGVEDIKSIITNYYNIKKIRKEDLLIRMKETETLDTNMIINKFKRLIEKEYLSILTNNLRKDKKFLVIDFNELSKFNPEIADMLLEQPEETIKAAGYAIEQLDIDNEEDTKVRFSNLPESQKIKIRDIRSKHLNKLFLIEGIVRQKGDVRPQVTSAKFECPSCGNVINCLQLEASFKEPTRCGCGRKGKFRLISKDLIDAQGLVLEEEPYDLEAGQQPKRINIFLKDDLVSPISEKRTEVGTKIQVAGMVKEVPIMLRTGSKSTKFDLLIEANYVGQMGDDFSSLEITKEDKERIIELSTRPEIFNLLKKSLIPSIKGHEEIKEGLLLQQLGGVKKERKGTAIRGDIHIILVGDPSSGKSQMTKRISTISPKAIFVTGTGVSDVGMTASVVKDELFKGFSLEAGAMVLAHNGGMCLDEMDKAKPEHLNSLHTPMEQQTVHINKANIQATLKAETWVLANANPKYGRFDPYAIIAEQITFPLTLLNRFDLIFVIRDIPDEKVDNEMADFILDMHEGVEENEEEVIDDDLLRKYISYARKNCKPKLTKKAREKIKKFYVKLRTSDKNEQIKNIPLNARQIDGLVRLSEGSAKTRLSNEITEEDAERAIKLLTYTLEKIGIDPNTGKIDMDRITTGISGSVRDVFSKVKKVIDELENEKGKIIAIEDIIKRADSYGVEEAKAEEAIEKLKRTGDLMEPRHGFLSKL